LAWNSSNGVAHINAAILRRAQLVLSWVTVRGHTVVCNQPLRMTQPPTLGGVWNEYRPMGGNLRPGKWPQVWRRTGHATSTLWCIHCALNGL